MKINRPMLRWLASVVMLAIINAQISTARGSQIFAVVTNNGDTGVSFATDGVNFLVGVQGDYVSPNTYHITGQMFGPSGALIGSRIDPVPTHTGGNPSVACSGTNYLMVWPDDYLNGDESSISAQLVGSAGGLIGGMIAITTTSEQRRPFAVYGGGKYLAVWEDTTSGTAAIYGQFIAAAGALSGPQMNICSDINNSQRYPAAAFDGSNFLVIWEKRRSSSPELWDTYGVFVSPAGVVGTPFAVSQTTSARYNPPAVIFNRTNYFAVWNRDTSLGGANAAVWNIYGRFVTPAGTFPGNELAIVTNNNPVYPAVAFDGANYLLTWNQGGGAANANAYFQFLNSGGQTIGCPFTPFSIQGSQIPLLATPLFDGKRFAAVATLSAGGFTPPANGAGIYGTFIPASTAPPQFCAGASCASNQFTLSLASTPGIDYAIQMATNLVAPNWISLATNYSPTNGLITFTDPGATNRSRFYRAVKQQ